MTARRDFLRGLVSLPLIGGGVAVGGKAACASDADAFLLSLEPSLVAKLAAYKDGLARFSKAESAFAKDRPARPVFDQERYLTLTGQDKLDYFRGWSPRVRAYEAEVARLSQHHCVEDERIRYEALEDDFINAIGEVVEAPATTLAGLKFKARMAEHDEEVKDSVIADLIAFQIGGLA